MSEFIQNDDYSCGLYALGYFLDYIGVKPSIPILRTLLNPNPITGTSHEAIRLGIMYYSVKFIEKESSDIKTLRKNLPAIINYQYDEDGHYGVAIKINNKYIHVFNPYNGKTEKVAIDIFNKTWYSNLYGKKWFLTVNRNG